MKKLIWPILALTLTACQDKVPERSTANLHELPAPELGENWTTKNEDQAENILNHTRDMVNERAATSGVMHRDAHPKAHGCVQATFTIDNKNLPAAQRVGVFGDDQKTFDAWVRYSNGDPDGAKKPDAEKDVRGMAVKLMNVADAASGSQDFLMITAKEFFSKDGDDYLALFKGLTGGSVRLALYALTHPLSAKRLLGARVQIANPLSSKYFSSVPYKLGDRSMRFKAEPCVASAAKMPANPSARYLQEALVKTLAAGYACYNFFVQPNLDPERNPVEDPRVVWDEKKSPYIKVATLTIPQQSGVTSVEQTNFCENLSMDPWHSHAQTRPLGQINRMRSLIYKEISRMRHDGNRTTVLEPVNHTPCVGATAVLCETPKK
jgi:catalase